MGFKKSFAVVLAAVVIVTVIGGESVNAGNNGEFGLKTCVLLKHELPNNFALKWFLDGKNRPDRDSFYYHYYRLTLAYSPYKYLELGLGYQDSYLKIGSGAGDWSNKAALLLDITFSGGIAGFSIKDRSRFVADNIYLGVVRKYRNCLIVSRKVNIGEKQISPCLESEIWTNLEKDADPVFYLYWLTLGVSKKISKSLILKPLLRIEYSNDGDKWSEPYYYPGMGAVVKF